MIEEQFSLNEIKQTSYDRKNETLKSMSPIYDLAMREITEDVIKHFSFLKSLIRSHTWIKHISF